MLHSRPGGSSLSTTSTPPLDHLHDGFCAALTQS